MKRNNFLICIILGLFVLVSSCDVDNEGREYTPKTDGASFYTSSATTRMEVSDESFDIHIARVKKEGTLEIPITIEDPSGLFTIPPVASFSEGEGYAILKGTFGNITVGERYNIKLSFPEEYIGERDSLISYNELNLTVYKDYSWKHYGIGKITSSIFGFADDVEIQQANENPHAYRVVDPYYVGYPLAFELTEDETAISKFFTQETGHKEGSYGMTSLRYRSSTISGKDISLMVDFIVYLSGGSIGSFGTFNEIITMP